MGACTCQRPLNFATFPRRQRLWRPGLQTRLAAQPVQGNPLRQAERAVVEAFTNAGIGRGDFGQQERAGR
jgi:hypothetical protein